MERLLNSFQAPISLKHRLDWGEGHLGTRAVARTNPSHVSGFTPPPGQARGPHPAPHLPLPLLRPRFIFPYVRCIGRKDRALPMFGLAGQYATENGLQIYRLRHCQIRGMIHTMRICLQQLHPLMLPLCTLRESAQKIVHAYDA